MAKVVPEQVYITDKELILLCQQCERERAPQEIRASFRQLYQRYQQRVRSTLYQLCGDRLLDDLVQEVFLRVWKGLPQLRQPAHFSTWLYRITWNVATDQRRKFALLREQEFTSPSSNTEESLENTNLTQLYYQELVQQGLQTLSFDHRVVLVLHDLEDLPQKQVANILNIPVGTVKSRIFHARSAMRKFLEQQGASL
ncbi:MAG: sigma-70 family RNA polymerase sigma factor [Gomphosphaeria aponina SAG 52.96 = DSM 107014]|uniref:Sigma-70 family RNA polymerase sigma factor n=1 Tax=Gomphosphaeria aponina SAG 52.96 = DSM 107014 TaxID=1521640 RepID=A0A941GP04_9CHRO|nr:sigma-70 family RNA polymerase sigma factor [Gomphosphaeria aponina SAG 52.96 = DSM 107014]